MTTSLAPGADEDQSDALPRCTELEKEQQSSKFIRFQCLFINEQGTFSLWLDIFFSFTNV